MKANLSIIVTRYNKPPEQVEECISSIQAQTVQPLEIILVDDGSENPYSHTAATTIILPKNVGVGIARDTGVRFSKGKLILFVDADDKISPDFIQQSGKEIANSDIVYTNFVNFGAVEKPMLHEPPAEIDPHMMLKRCEIRVSCMMHRRVYEKLGGFRELPMFEDWDFWLRAMCNGYTFKKSQGLLEYRQSSGSRNHQADWYTKNEAIAQITAAYEVKNGRLRERKHGR